MKNIRRQRPTKLTASKLRENIYQILDGILKSGKPIEVERKGRKIRLSPVDPPKKLSNLRKRDAIKGDPEDLVHIDWFSEWKPYKK